MRIYAVADIHGKSERFASIARVVEERRPDVLVVAGDICARFGPDPARDADTLSRLELPVLLLLGNSEPARFAKVFSDSPRISVIHLTQKRIAGTTFVGVSGAFSVPFSTRLALRQDVILEKLSSLLSPGHVLISHAPPFGACDKVMGRFSAGCKALADLVHKARPSVAICGHIHESPGAGMLGSTLVVNCAMGRSSGAIINLNGKEARAELLP
ncbi:MAG: metallophosphoesterase [Thermodesulfobacteriota bacterium]